MEIAPEIFLPGMEAAGMSLSAAWPLLGHSPGGSRGSPGGVELGGAVPALGCALGSPRYPRASQGVLGHPSVSVEPGWSLQRLRSCHHHGNVPQPAGRAAQSRG